MKALKLLLSFPKTIYFNFRVFPVKIALKLPVLVANNLKIDNIYKNCIEINSSKISPFMIKINIKSGSDGINCGLRNTGYFSVRKDSKIIFNGKANFSYGVSIRVDKGKMIFGNNFSCNKHCFFACSSKVIFGDNVLLGWNAHIRDSDGHTVYNLGKNKISKPNDKPVFIGDHVWIGAYVKILKGVRIPNNCVVGINSCVTKEFTEENSLIAGYPAKVISSNIDWEL